MTSPFNPHIRTDRLSPDITRDVVLQNLESTPRLGVFNEIHFVNDPDISTPPLLEAIIASDASGLRFIMDKPSGDFIFEWNSTVGKLRPGGTQHPDLGTSTAWWTNFYANLVLPGGTLPGLGVTSSVWDTLWIDNIRSNSVIDVHQTLQPEVDNTRELGSVSRRYFGIHSRRLRLYDFSTDPNINGEFRQNGADVKVYSGGAVRNFSDITGGGAPVGAAYVTIGNDATLSAERSLTGTGNQVVVTDNGVNSTVVLSTPQNIHTGANPTFAQLTLDGALLPGTTDFWDLGSTGLNWQDLNIRGIQSATGVVFIASDLDFNGNDILDLDTLQENGVEATIGFVRLVNNSGIYWRNNANTLNHAILLSTADDFILQRPSVHIGSVKPNSTNLYDLGITSFDWKDLWIRNIKSGLSAVAVFANLEPDLDNTKSLGSVSKRWSSMHSVLVQIDDSSTNPTANGEYRTNGTDAKVYSGGSVRNFSDISSNLSARVRRNGNQSITSATQTAIQFNLESFDPQGWHDNSTNNTRITVDVAGHYLVYAQAQFNNTTLNQNEISVRVNGSTITAQFTISLDVDHPFISIVDLVDLAANDYIEILVFHNKGSSENILGGSAATFCCVTKVG